MSDQSPPRQYILDQIQKWKVKAHDAQMIDDFRRSQFERGDALDHVKIFEAKLAEFDEAQP